MSQVTATNSGLAALTPGTWTVDAGHSSIGFVVRHLVVAKVRGQFTDFAGTITVGDDPLTSKVEATVQATSIDTRDEGRDGHLRSGDFFDVENHPTWSLVSTGIESTGGSYVLHTDLTIKGITSRSTSSSSSTASRSTRGTIRRRASPRRPRSAARTSAWSGTSRSRPVASSWPTR
jgi:polyisoprenoid-binding protein YceI